MRGSGRLTPRKTSTSPKVGSRPPDLVVLAYSGALAVDCLFFAMRENEGEARRREDVHQ